MLRILIVDDHVVVDTESYRLPCFSVSIAASCMLVAHIDIGDPHATSGALVCCHPLVTSNSSHKDSICRGKLTNLLPSP